MKKTLNSKPNPRLDPVFDFLTLVRASAQTPEKQQALLMENDFSRLKDSFYRLQNSEKNRLNAQIQEYSILSRRNIIDDTELSFLAAFFEAPYSTQLGFEFFEYRKLAPSPEILKNYPSIALPISILRSSAGLLPGRTVALFPENWRGKNPTSFTHEDRVYYFINKFVARHFTITRALIETCCNLEAFENLKAASRAEIELACCNWVTIHEHFHRKGRLPLPEYLEMKSSRSSAAIEELRVDVAAMLSLSTKQINREFILAERLLRYAVEASPANDYDAIGTQVLFQFLLLKSGITIDTLGLLQIKSSVWSCLALFSQVITELEAKAASLSTFKAKKVFQEFARELGNYSKSTGRYELLPFFKECRYKYETAFEPAKKAA